MPDLRAILVSVDYADVLSVTLPYNRHHFAECMVVTSLADEQSQRVAADNGCRVFMTDSFWENGAKFNKWRALEQGLDAFGRWGWLCVMDADILWPSVLPEFGLNIGKLYVPRRRMHPLTATVPDESTWPDCPYHRFHGWSGYTQIFHADDPALPVPPWHDVGYTHAGIADSLFGELWQGNDRVHPPFEVLHLGAAGQNWCGRRTPLIDGSEPEGKASADAAFRWMQETRAKSRHKGKGPYDPAKYQDERIDPSR